MWEIIQQNPVLLLLLPFVVYFVARILFVAYFHAKRDHIRRLTRGIDQAENKRRPGA